MKRVFIIHGWDDGPESTWFPWLEEQLEGKGFEVIVPAMPNTEEPEIGAWVGHLAKTVGEPDTNDIFVGHSIGCQTILRYIASLSDNTKTKGVVLVAPWLHLPYIAEEGEEVLALARPWLETPINFEKVKAHTGRIIAILSDNDPHGPIEDKPLYEQNLGAETIVERAQGHLGADVSLKELPVALGAVLRIAE